MAFTIRRPIIIDAEEVVSLSKEISDRYFENRDYIETGSLSNNEKMLAVQRKVGFKMVGSEVRLEKKL